MGGNPNSYARRLGSKQILDTSNYKDPELANRHQLEHERLKTQLAFEQEPTLSKHTIRMESVVGFRDGFIKSVAGSQYIFKIRRGIPIQ